MSKLNTISSLLLLALAGCAYSVHQVHTSDFLPGASMSQGKMIQAKSEQFVIMGITQDTSYVNRAYRDLMKACPDGAITGITTQLSTDLGFFSWTNKVFMQGLCVTKGAS